MVICQITRWLLVNVSDHAFTVRCRTQRREGLYDEQQTTSCLHRAGTTMGVSPNTSAAGPSWRREKKGERVSLSATSSHPTTTLSKSETPPLKDEVGLNKFK